MDLLESMCCHCSNEADFFMSEYNLQEKVQFLDLYNLISRENIF